MNPEQLLYNKTHEWVHVAEEGGAKIATIGISAFAVQQLTDLVYLELPAVGTEVDVGQSFGEIESVKAVSDLYSPVRGEIIEVNDELSNSLEKLGEDPYGAGWIIKVRMSDGSELSGLLDYPSYQRQCTDEA